MGDSWDTWGAGPATTQAAGGWDSGENDAGPIPADQWTAFVEATRGGLQAQLYRKQPTYCQGYLGTIEIDPHDPQGMVDAIAADWGGQVIQVRPLVKREDGSTGFGKGWMTLRISAPPKVRGVPWEQANRRAQGIIDTEAVSSAPAVPEQPQSMAGLEMFGQLLARMDQRNDARMSRLENMVAQMAQRGQVQQQPQDPFASLTGAMTMLKKFRALSDELSGFDGGYEDDEDEPDTRTTQERLIDTAGALFEKKIKSGWDPFEPNKQPTPAQQQPNATPSMGDVPASGGMRLVRGGNVVATAGNMPPTTPEQQQPQPPAAAAPASGITPEAVAAYLKNASPDDALAMLNQVQASMGPEAIERLMAQAAAKGA